MQDQEPQQPSDIECCAITELRRLLEQSTEKVLIIDVRSEEEYSEKHILSAKNIPLPELKYRLKELPYNSIIVTVCGKGGGRSAEAAELLRLSGFIQCRWLCNGTDGWFGGSEE